MTNDLPGATTCYTDASPTWKPVFKAGPTTITCTWMGPVQSIYCPELPVNAIPTGTHTLSYSVPDGSPAPFPTTTFAVYNEWAKGTLLPSGSYLSLPTCVGPTLTSLVLETASALLTTASSSPPSVLAATTTSVTTITVIQSSNRAFVDKC